MPDQQSTDPPSLIDTLATQAGLDSWDFAEAIANSKNYAVGGNVNLTQLAEAFLRPNTPAGKVGWIVLRRAWLDKFTLAQLIDVRSKASAYSRESLAEAFGQVLSMFGGAST